MRKKMLLVRERKRENEIKNYTELRQRKKILERWIENTRIRKEGKGNKEIREDNREEKA